MGNWRPAVLRLLTAAVLAVYLTAGSAVANIPSQVTVSLPVSAAVEGVTLEPGAYVMVIEGFSGGSATIKIYREGSSSQRVAAPVTAFRAPEAATRTAVKITARGGAYYLDKLVLAGETTGFQFRL